MKISDVKKKLTADGILDDRQLFCYSTLTGVLGGISFQNLVGIVFSQDELILYGANMDGSLKDVILCIPYTTVKNFEFTQRFLYSNVSFSAGIDTLRFYNYDKKIMKQGFEDAGLICKISRRRIFGRNFYPFFACFRAWAS